MKKNDIRIITPIEEKAPTLGKISDAAAGPKGVAISLQQIGKYSDVQGCTTTLLKLNQKDGFDCPGCAWPDPEDRSSVAEYCENGVKAVAEEATTRRATPHFFAKHSIKELAEMSDFELGKSGRLTHPMLLKPGGTHYKETSWEEAFSLIANKLNSLASPNEAIFYTSGRTSNEAAFLYQLFVRAYGTNNLPDCSNMCHESTGVALSETVGIGKGTVKLEDFYVTDLVICIGQNPGTNHPRMLSALQKAKRNGAKIITVNPLPEVGLMRFKHPQEVSGWLGKGTKLTDLFVPVTINGDVAFLKAIMLLLTEKEDENPGSVFDHDFIKEYSEGFEEMIADVKRHDFEELCIAAGVPAIKVRKAAAMIAESKKIIICWAMGITQHKNGVENIREIANLLLSVGSIGKPGAGLCPVRGHSNVQGDRTIGIWEHLSPALEKGIKRTFNFQAPKETGYNAVNAVKAMHNDKASFFFAMGGNFLSAMSDTEYTAEALQKCDMTVQVSTKLNRSHLITGTTAIILPCLGRTETDLQEGNAQFVSVENSMGIVHSSRGHRTPPSDAVLSEPMIVGRMAQAVLGNKMDIDWVWYATDYDRIRGAISTTIPGFEDYNNRVRREGGFYLPNGPRERKFTTKSGKAGFTINPVPEHNLKEGSYKMMTIRSHDQYNTTIYDLNDRYRGVYNGRRVVFMNADDMKKAGLKQGDFVDLLSYYDEKERVAPRFMVVSYDIPRQCTATYFPEANILISINSKADRSDTPASKLVVVTMRKCE
ncbi:MAG: molybdopterin-dependent oxidoreductase alpha subunit [Saprospiraceae bacterium]|jgi:molybdopterin-dependent oxidoreductase alpha subunit